MRIRNTSARSRRGSALLAVLWVSAALAAIAFSLSNTVLGETQRTSTSVDGLRAYYLATSGIMRAEYEVLWGRYSSQAAVRMDAGRVDYMFPSGQVRVEIIPETAKLNINEAPPEQLYKLLTAIGLDSGQAGSITAGIVDWRSGAPGSGFDQYYLSLTPSFQARHASFEEIEELLSVRGITPELFYGTYVPTADNAGGLRLAPRVGLVDCLSVFGSTDGIDVNTAAAPVLAAVGVSPDAINAILARRREKPFTPAEMGNVIAMAGSAGPLRVGGKSILTLRATARLRLENGQASDLRRTVAAQVKYMPDGSEAPIHTLRWYDTSWSY